ncbi:DUF6465 family protein [Tannockella kyphosi]|uniref:DUF6465 family protein n=1 Tax=Tannockella kyphosi TaxID=2899121 RepID=UPI002012EED3|nr:DUF6465 family protein [Tannockella kyphosi]
MKASMEVQFLGSNVVVADLEKAVKEELKAQKVKVTQIDTLEMFYKPTESVVYYLATMKDESIIDGNINL